MLQALVLTTALLAVGCSESVSPDARDPGRPAFWLIGQPPPPAPPPPVRVLHLDFTLEPNPAYEPTAPPPLAQCTAVPAVPNVTPGSTIMVTVEVKDETGVTISDFDGDVSLALGQNAASGTLCGTKMIHLTSGTPAVAQFVDLGVDQSALPPSVTYTLVASVTDVTSAESTPFCVGLCFF